MKYKISIICAFIFLISEGIFAQNFWQTTNNISGGLVSTVSKVTSNIMVAGSIRGGLFRSIDGGLNWSSISSEVSNYQVFVVKTSLAGVVFAGTNRSIYKSTDQGLNWTLSNSGLPSSNYVEDITFDASGNVYIAASTLGIYKSTNNGSSWFAINNGLPTNPYIRFIEFTSTNTLFATDQNDGIYKSTDLGNSWVSSNSGFIAGANPAGIASSPIGHIIVPTAYQGIFSSTDNGATWNLINGDITYPFVYGVDINSSGHIFLSCYLYMFKSTNGGSNWIDITPTSVKTGIMSVDIDNNNNVWMGTYYNGIAKSTDSGISWTFCENGISSTVIQSLFSDGSGTLFAAVQGKGFYKSVDNGVNWTKVIISDDAYHQNIICAAFIPSGGLMVNSSTGGIYVSTDYTNWVSFQTGLPNTSTLKLAASSNYYYAGAYNGKIYRTSVAAAAWVDITDTLSIIYIYDIETRNPSEVYIATDKGVYKSTNNGDTWININNGIPVTYYFSITFHPNGDIFVGESSKIYRSTNGGNSWTASSSNISGLSIIAHSDGSLYAGTFSSAYKSTDLGNNWNLIGDGMQNININALAFGNSNILFAGTESFGIYRTSFPVTSVESYELMKVESFKLSQNYPNPFNPTTQIAFTIPSGARNHVTLKVYDILGNEVATLANEYKPAGSYEVSFDAHNLSSGLYIYTLNAGNFSSTKKMMLIK